MQLLGNSTQKKLVREIFGSLELFQSELAKKKNKSFFFKKSVVVSWDKEKERHEFFWP